MTGRTLHSHTKRLCAMASGSFSSGIGEEGEILAGHIGLEVGLGQAQALQRAGKEQEAGEARWEAGQGKSTRDWLGLLMLR